MAKRMSGDDWRRLLAAVVMEFGTRKVIGPYILIIPPRALRQVSDEGKLSAIELASGGRLLTYTPSTPAPKPRR